MNTNNLPAVSDFQQAKEVAITFFKSGLFSDTKSAEQAIVKILAGRELGMGPFESMRDISIIQGKTTLAAAQVAARIKKTGSYDYEIIQFDEKAAVLRFTKNGKALKPDISFTIDDARRLGLAGKDNYSKQARTMLFWRAVTMGARMHCPEVFGGAIYTPDELKTGTIEDLPSPPETPVEPEQAKAPEIPAPAERHVALDNPWTHVLELADESVKSDHRGKPLCEIPTSWFQKALRPGNRKLLSANDLANCTAAQKQLDAGTFAGPRDEAQAQILAANEPGALSLEEDSIPEFEFEGEVA